MAPFFKPKSREEMINETKRNNFERSNLEMQHKTESDYKESKKKLRDEKLKPVKNALSSLRRGLSAIKTKNSNETIFGTKKLDYGLGSGISKKKKKGEYF